MKKQVLGLIIILFALVSFSNNSHARPRKPRSVVVFSLSDGSPLTIAVNDRYYKKIARRITLNDLPGKRPYVKVYRYRPYADGKGGKAELVFSSTIKLTPGQSYEAIVDPQSRKLNLRPLRQNVPPPSNNYNNNQSNYSSQPPAMLSSSLMVLENNMDKEDTESGKMRLAKQYADNNTISSEDVKNIATWLLFDDSRVDFVKYTYPKVTDKSNFAAQLTDVFSTEVSQKSFKQYMDSVSR